MRIKLCPFSLHDAGAASPLDGRNSVFRDIERIVIGKNIGFFTDAYVIALVPGIPI